jgi:hypothetical protein
MKIAASSCCWWHDSLESAVCKASAATLIFETGVPVQLMLDSSQPRIQERIEISGHYEGENSLLIINNVQSMELHRQGRNGIDLAGPSGYLEPPDIHPDFDLADIRLWRPDFGIPNMGQSRLFFQGYVGEVREFVNAIQENASLGREQTMRLERCGLLKPFFVNPRVE